MMIGKLNDLFIAAGVMWSHFMEDFKNDENGSVVEVVLLILVSVLAISLVWGLMSGQLQQWWDQIVNKAASDLN